MAKKYISLRGKFSLAPIVEGVVGAMRELGNIPDFTLEITADKIEHTESMSGDDTTDLVLYNTTAVSFSGTLEQVDADLVGIDVLQRANAGVQHMSAAGKLWMPFLFEAKIFNVN